MAKQLISVDANKVADVIIFQRTGILEAAAPYSAMRIVMAFSGLVGEAVFHPPTAIGPFVAGTDIGFMAKVEAQTGAIDVDFELFL